MARPNLTSIYTQGSSYSVLTMLKELVAAVDDIDYTPASDFSELSSEVDNISDEVDSISDDVTLLDGRVQTNTEMIETALSRALYLYCVSMGGPGYGVYISFISNVDYSIDLLTVTFNSTDGYFLIKYNGGQFPTTKEKLIVEFTLHGSTGGGGTNLLFNVSDNSTTSGTGIKLYSYKIENGALVQDTFAYTTNTKYKYRLI